MKKNDFVLLLLIILVTVLSWGLYCKFGTRSAGMAQVIVDGELFGTYSLYEEREISIHKGNVLWIHDGVADMKSADCPDKICVNHQNISKARETIVCLPNKVVIKIVGGEDTTLDAMAQ